MTAGEQELPVPPWRKQRKAAPVKQPLTQDAIVDTALRVVRAEGLDGVSMRRVAQELGTGPASLYAHVSGKEELLELMLDRAAGEIEVLAADPARWQEQLKEMARSARRVWVSYGDLVLVSLANIPTGHNQLRLAEGMLAIIRAGKVPDQIAAWFVDRLGLYIDSDAYEGSIWAQKLRQGHDPEAYFGQIRTYFESLPPERFPVITSMVGELMAAGDDERFEFGLDLLVRGLASYVKD